MFDKAASNYDKDFTYSNIGKLQRNRVWKYLDKTIDSKTQLNILELNCGTGEDAIRFAQRGHKVTATDLSDEMLKITREKVLKNNLRDNVQTVICDIKALDTCEFPAKFDLIFSNFGGLNCLNYNELKNTSAHLFQLLKPNGRFIVIIMPRFCIWESIYFLLKLDWHKAFRRNTHKSLQVRVGEEFIETWYYSPFSFYQIFKQHFKKLNSRPIGITIPPSYMENTLGKRKKIMNFLSGAEYIFGEISFLTNLSDHFLIDMQKKDIL